MKNVSSEWIIISENSDNQGEEMCEFQAEEVHNPSASTY
jgi:hypothetical protein